MAFLRKVGRVGCAANMAFADAMGLDESPSGGTKSSHHENGFKVSGNARIAFFVSTVCCAHYIFIILIFVHLTLSSNNCKCNRM